jgi:hypothetical protein
VLRGQHRRLRPVETGLLAREQPFGGRVRLAFEAHALADFGLDALPAAVFGHQHRAFIVRLQAGRAEHIGREAPRKAQDLRRVAIVDLEHRRAALASMPSWLQTGRARPEVMRLVSYVATLLDGVQHPHQVIDGFAALIWRHKA